MAEPECTMCFGNGWVFDCKTNKLGPAMLEMMPCLHPECPFSGRPILNLNFYGVDFVHVHREPNKERIMSIGTDALDAREPMKPGGFMSMEEFEKKYRATFGDAEWEKEWRRIMGDDR